MTSPIRLSLPFPPSLWALYVRSGYNQCKSSAYRKWITEAGWILITQRNIGRRHKRIDDAVAVEIAVLPPTKGKRPDIDNIIKPVLDLLVSTQTIKDDDQVADIRAYWSAEGVPCEVTVSRISDAPLQVAAI